MNRFTLRSALVLAVVLLLAGATTSFGQVIFSASAGNPQVRIGGMSETVGDITLTSNGATFPASSGNAIITLTYSTTIANKTTTSSAATCVSGAVCGTAAGFAVPATTGVLPANAMVIGPAAGNTQGIVVYVKNLVAGVANTTINWTVAGNTLTITFAPAAGGTIAFVDTRVGVNYNAAITIHGVRLNAAGLGIPPALPTVSTFVNTTPSANLQLAAGSTSLTVGTLANPLPSVTRIGGSTNSADYFYKVIVAVVNQSFGTTCVLPDVCNAAISINPKSTYTSCGFRGIPQSAAAGGTVVITGDVTTYNAFRSGTNDFGGNGGANAIGIKIVEGYPGALTSKTDETVKSGDSQAVTGVWPTGITHEVDNGTRVRIDFSGLPAQIVVGAPIRVLATSSLPTGAVSGLSMDLVGNTQCAVLACGASHTALADVRSASGGAVTVEYEVTANTGGSSGTASGIQFPIFLWYSSSPVDLSTINISVRLGPILGSSIVRFSDQQTAATATVAINTCTTDLFYPFVTNIAGFDTGIYVVNGGQARSGNSGQSGTCVARFFDGSTTGTTAVKTSTTPTLGPGQSFSFTASDATLGKPGFGNGYVDIRCSFEGAHGAAYVTFGYGTATVGSAPPGTMYLALVGDPTGARSSR